MRLLGIMKKLGIGLTVFYVFLILYSYFPPFTGLMDQICTQIGNVLIGLLVFRVAIEFFKRN